MQGRTVRAFAAPVTMDERACRCRGVLSTANSEGLSLLELFEYVDAELV
jgi:hypothetical protein